MAKKKEQETSAHILKEMRDVFNRSWYDIDREWAHDLADRLEAAHRRELFEAEASALEIAGYIEAARRKPARNCDVGTPETQVVRMSAFCLGHQPHGEVTNCPGCPIKSGSYFLCALRWGQMPYEGEPKEGVTK